MKRRRGKGNELSALERKALGLAPDLTTLAWLIAALAVVLLPHLARAPVWYLPLFLLAAAERLSHEFRQRRPVPGWLRLAITAGAVAAIGAEYGTILGRRAGVALLCVMIALKLLETYRRRDVYFLISLGYFVAVTQFLFSQSVYLLLYIAVAVVLITGTLVVHETQPTRQAGRRVQSQGLLPMLRSVGVMTLQALPLMVAMFVLFPRLATPLWGLPEDALEGRTGISGEMSPGSMLELFIDDSPAFRASFEGPPPPPEARYWRGPVLWSFDGRTWRRPSRALRVPATVDAGRLGPRYRYQVTMEPTEKFWLFALDVPVTVPGDARMQIDHTLYRDRPVMSLLAYEVVSDPGYLTGARLSPTERAAALALPGDFNPRSRELAARWRAEAGSDDLGVVNRALALFSQDPFAYSFTPPPLGRDSVDDFLFDTREGFCEYYASAFAFLMRAAGVPARVVTGYQGGWYNARGGYLLVRQSDAHAWAEVWLPERGWLRVDPTAAVAPERVETGAVESLGLRRGTFDFDWLRAIRNRLDGIHNFWNQWVLQFNRDSQRSLLRYAGFDDFDLRYAAIALVLVLTVALFVVMRAVLRSEWLGGLDAAAREYARFCRKLARRGVRRSVSEGPRAFATRAQRALPGRAGQIRHITDLYVRIRYAGDETPERLKALRSAVRRFSAADRKAPA